MKKIFIGILLFGFLCVHSLEAKGSKVFDLKSQYFSETFVKKGKKHYSEARYDVGDVIVTTDTKFNGKSYMNGVFTVDIKEPLENWNVNIKKKSGTYSVGEVTAIRLTSDNGSSYFIIYNSITSSRNDKIQINDKTFDVKLANNPILTATISNINGKVKFSINGKGFLKIDSKNFGNLEKVEVEVNDNYYGDELLALDIYRVE